MGLFLDFARLYMSSCPPNENFFCVTAPPIKARNSSLLSPPVIESKTYKAGVVSSCTGVATARGMTTAHTSSINLTSKGISQTEVLCTEEADLEFAVRSDAQTVARAAEVLAHGRDEPHTPTDSETAHGHVRGGSRVNVHGISIF